MGYAALDFLSCVAIKGFGAPAPVRYAAAQPASEQRVVRLLQQVGVTAKLPGNFLPPHIFPFDYRTRQYQQSNQCAAAQPQYPTLARSFNVCRRLTPCEKVKLFVTEGIHGGAELIHGLPSLASANLRERRGDLRGFVKFNGLFQYVTFSRRRGG